MTLKKLFAVIGLLACLLFPGFAFAQAPGTVKGIVRDQDGTPLIGAGVYVDGQSSAGTVTDFDGQFSITVP